MNLEIKQLTDRDHILLRPSMYIGSISKESTNEYIITDKLEYRTLEYTPALLKIIYEILDNAVDIICKTNIKNPQIKVEINNDYIEILDNANGFLEQKDVEYPPLLAFGSARAGSNFNDSDNIGQIGTNGVGSFATNCFSEWFKVITSNGKFKTTIEFTNNSKDYTIDKVKSKDKFTLVRFKPDYSRFKDFNIKELETIQEVIKTRCSLLSYTYDIKFTVNGESIKPFNKSLLDSLVDYKTDDYEILLSVQHDTKPLNIINGLNIKDGGSNIDYINSEILNALNTSKLPVTKNDITSTLRIAFIGKNFKNLRYNSQTKEKITNSTKEVKDYLGDLDQFLKKVARSKDIKTALKLSIDARNLKQTNKDLKKITKQKIKSDKFLDSQTTRDNLVIVEGDSALGGLVPTLGRKGFAYYALKGKPLNAFSNSTNKVIQNKELSDLLNIIKNSDFKRIIIATDQDLDGFHIRGLLLGFFFKYLKNSNIYFLNTPVKAVTKNDKIIRWSYSLFEDLDLKPSEHTNYYKGLGSWDSKDLKYVIEQDTLDKMLLKIDLDDENILEDFLGNDSTKRKDYIIKSDFELIKV